ncbi:MAG TPA: hypothetical protein VLK84_05090 [Longimicrobium sp.]|nr:hypothetical protein [Longimicrobium sp.]
MRKLKLEALHVDSFETTSAPSRMRGTIQANAEVTGTTVNPGTGVSECVQCHPMTADVGCGPETYNALVCGETRHFDCTFQCSAGCSDKTSCGDICWVGYTDGCP